MALPDIDLYKIRPHRSSQADAFEELCCQLANDEPIDDRIRFDRKGRGGDAGVESFATLKDGAEIGWQVKFYSDFKGMITSLKQSLETALIKHPAMTRFIACFPFDLSDSRRENVQTALAEWSKWTTEQTELCVASGRKISIERWDAHEIKIRLTANNPRAAGRVAFWFDHEMMTPEWLSNAFERVKYSLGDRYSPENHVNQPVRQSILASLRDPSVFVEIQDHAEKIGDILRSMPGCGDGDEKNIINGGVSALRQAALSRPEPFPVTDLKNTVEEATDAAMTWRNQLKIKHPEQDKSHPSLTKASNLVSALYAAARMLGSDRCQHINSCALLIMGDAGSGKSHLLADACAHQLHHNRPALMILGGKLPDAEPWGEILKELDLPKHLQVKHFLGALNAAGETAGVRTLIAIDALNEKNGQSIWPERLPGLLKDLSEFPWITVALSCRSTYEGVVIPAMLDANKLPRIHLQGFSDAEVVHYLSKRGITVPETPRQLEELHNPLFLRLASDAVNNGESETILPETLSGISGAVALYTAAVIKRVETSLRVVSARRIVQKAIALLVKEMADTGRGQLGYGRADALIRTIHNGSEMAQDLLFQLANEGMLAIERDTHSVSDEDEIVRFEFERVGDHTITANLLERSILNGISEICQPDMPLHTALSDEGSFIRAGLLEALAVQLPEKYNIELLDLPGIPCTGWLAVPFEKSLLTRQLSVFSARTWQLVEETGDDDLRYDTLITLASEPGHSFNVTFLDTELRPLGMPERDACWTAYLAYSDRADHLVNWAWRANQSRITTERAELAAVQLAWFLTATRRPLRDRATKALVALLADRPALASAVWDRFRGLDDGYVTERILASLYGAAMQGRWRQDQLSSTALTIHRDLISDQRLTENALLRDHALGLIDYAKLNATADDPVLMITLQVSFKSAWPIEFVSEDTIDAYMRDYGAGRRGHDEIVNSCIDGDFGRYVLDPAVRDWSPAPLGTAVLPTALDLQEEWFEQFKSVATPEMLEAHEALVNALSHEGPNSHAFTTEKRARIKEAKSHFRTVVGDSAYEEWRAKAENWRTDGMYQRIAGKSAAEFNLGWARRWVVMRAHELGWSSELHGRFDARIRGSRNEHMLERIGKKYQWLALYELVARMSDNLARLPSWDDDDVTLRNLDPSLLVEHTSEVGWRSFKGEAFWAGTPPYLPAMTPAEAIAWLDSDGDLLDGIDVILVTSPEDERTWLVLSGFESWSESVQDIRTESWRRVGCIVIPAQDLATALNIMSSDHFTSDSDLPGAEGGGYHVHLGEYPKHRLTAGYTDWIGEWQPHGFRGRPGTAISVLPTTAEYSAEAGGYDGSVTDTIGISMPASWIMDEMKIRLKDGRSILFQDSSNKVMFWDPAVTHAGRSAGLIDRKAFLELLHELGLIAVWAVAGEKNAYSEGPGNGFGGRVTYTRLYHSSGEEIREMPCFRSFDKPSEEQLKEFMGDARGTED
ncbi:AAA family ATPase [Raoultella terrigena]|uniref:AAA family ATPase n=1 Tax=Raoultella terrigena TaxID=577 RepID=UPI0009783B60|nr:AAA family ATPase [Raoultella terrigena]OMP95932.1 AAA family ATPase [Raoultella terrigena]